MDHRFSSNFIFQPMINPLNDDVAQGGILAMMLLTQHLDGIHPFRRQCELHPVLESFGGGSTTNSGIGQGAAPASVHMKIE
jgi:hypothetical protein